MNAGMRPAIVSIEYTHDNKSYVFEMGIYLYFLAAAINKILLIYVYVLSIL